MPGPYPEEHTPDEYQVTSDDDWDGPPTSESSSVPNFHLSKSKEKKGAPSDPNTPPDSENIKPGHYLIQHQSGLQLSWRAKNAILLQPGEADVKIWNIQPCHRIGGKEELIGYSIMDADKNKRGLYLVHVGKTIKMQVRVSQLAGSPEEIAAWKFMKKPEKAEEKLHPLIPYYDDHFLAQNADNKAEAKLLFLPSSKFVDRNLRINGWKLIPADPNKKH